RDRFSFARHALQACSKGSKVNQFGYARFQRARARSEKTQESSVKNDWPEINARNANLVVNQQTDRNQIEDDHRNNHPVAKPHTGQTFSCAVIFGDGLKRDAPPEIAVNLNVPVIPAAVGGIAPAFFLQQPKHFAQEIMAVPPLLAPKYTPAEATSRARAFGQMFALPDDVCRCAFETQPGEIPGESAHERLHKREDHNEQARVHRVESW